MKRKKKLNFATSARLRKRFLFSFGCFRFRLYWRNFLLRLCVASFDGLVAAWLCAVSMCLRPTATSFSTVTTNYFVVVVARLSFSVVSVACFAALHLYIDCRSNLSCLKSLSLRHFCIVLTLLVVVRACVCALFERGNKRRLNRFFFFIRFFSFQPRQRMRK